MSIFDMGNITFDAAYFDNVLSGVPSISYTGPTYGNYPNDTFTIDTTQPANTLINDYTIGNLKAYASTMQLLPMLDTQATLVEAKALNSDRVFRKLHRFPGGFSLCGRSAEVSLGSFSFFAVCVLDTLTVWSVDEDTDTKSVVTRFHGFLDLPEDDRRVLAVWALDYYIADSEKPLTSRRFPDLEYSFTNESLVNSGIYSTLNNGYTQSISQYINYPSKV